MFNINKGGAGDIETFAMKNCMMLLSAQTLAATPAQSAMDDVGRAYECKTCGKKFPSFQALGGHRASHNKTKNATDVSGSSAIDDGALAKRKTHACSICGKEFPVGQALGGHMRCHRPVGVVGGSRNGSTVTNEGSVQNSDGNNNKRDNDDVLSGEVRLEAKKLKKEPVCLELKLWFQPRLVDSGDVMGDGEAEKRQIVNEDEEREFLELELRQPI